MNCIYRLIPLHLQAWDVYAILNMLYSLVERSQIREQLSAVNKGGELLALVLLLVILLPLRAL